MATDKQLLIAFRDQFNTGRMFTESQVLTLMGYARGEATKQESPGITVLERINDIFQEEFSGHPSREEQAKNEKAITFLAEQIDILHLYRIRGKK
jgi:hypothetical protein